MENLVANLRTRVDGAIWDVDLRTLQPARRLLFKGVRLIYVIVREVLRGEINLRAMSLVYTSLLSLVPLLAVSFAVLKAFDVHNHVQPLLENFMAPLGTKGIELAERVVGMVENIKVGWLGTVGGGLLLYTGSSLLQKTEEAFNHVWRIKTLRSFSRRLSGYLAALLIGPALAFSILGIVDSATSMQAVEPLGALLDKTKGLVPYLLVWAAFVFINMFVPNTRVSLRAAAVGGLVSGLLWQTTAWGFGAFIASSVRYSRIYSSFAIGVVALIWLYWSWIILLLGAQLAFFIQNPQYLTRQHLQLALSNRLKERLVLTVMYLVGLHHYLNREPWTTEALSERVDVPVESLHPLLTLLKEERFLEQNAEDPPAYLPARDLDTVQVGDLLARVRSAGEGELLRQELLPPFAPIDDVLVHGEQAARAALGTLTIKDLVLRDATDGPREVLARKGPA